jgi:uncharacterized delta-60 repeat protein
MRIEPYRTVFLSAGFSCVALALIAGFMQEVAAQNAGELDQTFGSSGVVTLAIPDASNTLADQGSAVAIQADGKIVVAGTSDIGSAQGSRFAVARLNEDGSLDGSFGSGGIVTFAVPEAVDTLDDRAGAVAIQADGKIVVAGTSDIGGIQGSRFTLVRLNDDGGPDDSFGNNGAIRIPIPDPSNTLPDRANAIAIQDDGNIVALGTSDIGSALGSRFAVAKILSEKESDGGLVTAPGSGGGCFIGSSRGGWRRRE